MLLRRFYVQENTKGGRPSSTNKLLVLTVMEAPEPHSKGTRELKTEILPVEVDQILP